MTGRRIVVLGASGYVGTTLVESLLGKPGDDVVPVIHSAASAWRLGRHGIRLAQVDVCDRGSVREALRGATHVVNCTRGSRNVMIDGLRNILRGCLDAGVGRFVHLSSVMVYGDPPHPDSHTEDAPAEPEKGEDSYGYIKLQQDRMVQSAARSGLASVVLCPPNISGPHSGYLTGIVNSLREGRFALLDAGHSPCNLVDVRNLCDAIGLSLGSDSAPLDGSRMFVTDGEEVSWADVIRELGALAEGAPVRSVSRSELLALIASQRKTGRPSLTAAIRHLASSDVRAALRKDPLWEKVDRFLRKVVSRIGTGFEEGLRRRVEGSLGVSRVERHVDLPLGLCAQQLRGVRHGNRRIEKRLGFQPRFGFLQSMRDFRAAYVSLTGMDSAFWPLARRLWLT